MVSFALKARSCVRLTFGVGKANSKSLSLRFALANIGRRVPYPTPVTTDIGGELHIRDN